jgi:hypothetical protein
MTSYNKTAKRPVKFLSFEESERKDIASRMSKEAFSKGMTLYNCCNEDIASMAPEIKKAHCIDNEILARTDRFGVHRSLKPAPSRKGCGCYKSRDIGSYSLACAHGCLYCYANPRIG